MRAAAFIMPAIQLSARRTCRHEHRLISDVRPHVKHTDFATTGDHRRAFRVVLMSSDLRPSLAADMRDMLVLCSPLYVLMVLVLLCRVSSAE